MEKQIELTPENIPEVIVTNPMTAKCIFQKGMEYERTIKNKFPIYIQYLPPENPNIYRWNYGVEDNPYEQF